MMRLSEVPPRVQTHRRTLIALVRRGSGCWRAHRVSGSAEGAEGGMRGAEGGALERMGRAAHAREGCLGQWRERVWGCRSGPPVQGQYQRQGSACPEAEAGNKQADDAAFAGPRSPVPHA